jgi:hypothetical protein
MLRALVGTKSKLMKLNYKCEFCEKLFAKEKTLVIHICEQKRRHLGKSEKHVQLGLLTFQRFYELTQKAGKPKTFDEFATSSFYTAFVKFGSFLSNTNPIYPERFIDFVVKSELNLIIGVEMNCMTSTLVSLLKLSLPTEQYKELSKL